MNTYYVDINVHCHTDNCQEGDDSWYEHCENTFRNVYLENPKHWGTDSVQSSLELARGDTIFVVWYEYSYGDSFGHGFANGTGIAAIVRNYDDALVIQKLIEEYTDSSYAAIRYTDKDGQEILVHPSWFGYFETLESVHIEEEVIR